MEGNDRQMITIYLMRHGESEANVDTNIYQTKDHFEIELTEKGKEQTERLAKFLENDIKKRELSSAVIFSSPYKRTMQTAKAITERFGGIWIRENPLLIDKIFGEQEGCNDIDSFGARPAENHFYNTLGYLAYKPLRGESMLDVYIRTSTFVATQGHFQYGPEAIVIVSHRDTCLMLDAFLQSKVPMQKERWENAEVRIYENISFARYKFSEKILNS
jgi:broad specificity phosphatase PhoE